MIIKKMFVGFFIIVLFTLCNGNNNAMGQLASTPPTSLSVGKTEQPKGGGQPVQPTENGKCTPSAYLPDPTTGCCGRQRSTVDKITIGLDEAAAIDQYPWVVIIEYIKNNNTKLLCGGTLISSKYVLTAAHCVVGNVLLSAAGTPQNVRLGEYDVSNKITEKDCTERPGSGDIECNTGAVVIPIEKIIAHPEYNPKSRLRRNDIALLRLERLAPYTDFISPICIPSTDVAVSPPKEPLYIAGWGEISKAQRSSDIKLFIDVPFVPAEQCQPFYNVTGRKAQLWEGQICAGGEKGKDSCKGNSGLMYENDNTFEVVGVISFGINPCGKADVPDVYTNVFAYNDWIRSQVQP